MSEAIELLWRNGTGIKRPFGAVAGVSCRCSSLPLPRVMTDVGADHAVGQVLAKLQEHYGMAMPASTIQPTTEQHVAASYAQEVARVIDPGTAAGVIFVGKLDDSMVPVVEPSPEAADQRRGKRLSWKEVHLNLVHPQGRLTPVLGGILPMASRKAGGHGGGVRRRPGSGRGVDVGAPAEPGQPGLGSLLARGRKKSRRNRPVIASL